MIDSVVISCISWTFGWRGELLLLASSCSYLKLTLRPFAIEYKLAEIRISNSKSESFVFIWEKLKCLPWGGAELLPQVHQFVSESYSLKSEK